MSASSTRPPASSADAASSARGQAIGSSLRRAAVVLAIVVVLDQLAKQWAVVALDDGPIDLVGSLRLKLAFNSGTAFSLGAGRGGLISLLGLLVVVGILPGVLRWPGRLPAVAAGLIAGGAVGNLLDRLLRSGDGGALGGRVIDFVDLQWWPVFNVADAAICIGAALLALLSLKQPDPT